MRVTTTAAYRNFSGSVNDVHSRLNKSMNKISSGKAYEKAADNPLAYYEGKKIDNQYLDTLSKLNLIPDVKNRLYQQELGIRDYEVLPGNLLRLYDRLDRPQTVTAALMGAGVALIGAENKNANLEDYFLGLIGGVRHG